MLDFWRQDLRHALRRLRRSPGFTVTAVLILALGVGANAAVFSLVDAVLLRPLPYGEPDRLVQLWPGMGVNKWILAELAESGGALAGVTGYHAVSLTAGGDGEPAAIPAAEVSAAHFAVLGVDPLLGRGFTAEEARPDRSAVVILSHALWQTRYGGDPAILGRRVELAGAGQPRRTVVGVMAAEHRPLGAGWQAWVPLAMPAELERDATWSLELVGRLAPGAGVGDAAAQVDRLARRAQHELYANLPNERVESAGAAPLADALVGPEARVRLLALMAAVGLVLLVACVNLAQLTLARAAGRRRELAVRAALGATPRRLLAPILAENLLLAVAGGVLGSALAGGFLRALVALLPLPAGSAPALDLRVLAFALALALAAGLLVALAPARTAGRTAPRKALGGGRNAAAAGRSRGADRALVMAQVAVATVLLAGAGLLARSLWQLGRLDPGFDARGVLVATLSPPQARYPGPAQRAEYFRRVLAEVRRLPGVTAAGAAHRVPLVSGGDSRPFVPEGTTVPAGQPAPRADFRVVTPGALAALGVPLLRGRGLTAADRAGAAGAVVVSRRLAEEIWPGQEPLGRELRLFHGRGPRFTVVGVAGDVRHARLDAGPRPTFYFAHDQLELADPDGEVGPALHLVVRSGGEPLALAAAVRRAVWAVDPEVPVAGLGSLELAVAATLGDRRALALLLAFFAAAALTLGALGVYGTVSHGVGRRVHEIGVRMALGAERGDVLRRVLAGGLAPVALGLAVGLAAAAALGRLLAGLLYGVAPHDPATLTATAAVLAATGVLAAWLPARRASRLDPLAALRG